MRVFSSLLCCMGSVKGQIERKQRDAIQVVEARSERECSLQRCRVGRDSHQLILDHGNFVIGATEAAREKKREKERERERER
jgi:hypothetical protein